MIYCDAETEELDMPVLLEGTIYDQYIRLLLLATRLTTSKGLQTMNTPEVST